MTKLSFEKHKNLFPDKPDKLEKIVKDVMYDYIKKLG